MSESQESNSRIVTEDAIDLRRLFEALLREKLTVIGLTAIAAILSVFYALQIPDTYYSSALLVAKNTQNDTSSLSRIAGQYGGLASLAGVSMGSDGATQSEIAIETLRSLRFFHNYMYEHVLVDLMATKSWNSDLKSLSIDPTIYDEANSNWVREVSHPKQKKPSVQEAFSVFSNAVSVTQDKQTTFVTIAAVHISPDVAMRWVDLMVTGINDAIRGKSVEEAQRSIDYLTMQLEQTVLVNLDTIFAQLIEEQTKTIMLAHASDDYVFQVIEPPVASEVKEGPQRIRICVIGTLIGLLLSLLVVLIRQYREET